MSYKKFYNKLHYKSSILNSAEEVFINHNFKKLTLLDKNYDINKIINNYKNEFRTPEMFYYIENNSKVTGIILSDEISSITEILLIVIDISNNLNLDNKEFKISSNNKFLKYSLLHFQDAFSITYENKNTFSITNNYYDLISNTQKIIINNIEYYKFSIDIDSLIINALKNNIKFKKNYNSTLVITKATSFPKSLSIIRTLRSQGTIIEHFHNEISFDDSVKYAKEKKFAGMLFFHDSRFVTALNVNDDKMNKIDIDSLI